MHRIDAVVPVQTSDQTLQLDRQGPCRKCRIRQLVLHRIVSCVRENKGLQDSLTLWRSVLRTFLQWEKETLNSLDCRRFGRMPTLTR